MPTVVADAALPAKLASLTEPTDILDETGRKLGRFTPEPAAAEPLVPWDPSITQEELDRRHRAARGRTLAEVLQRLGVP
jgi:hypothetical protein